MNINLTELVYMQDFTALNHEATVVSISLENNRYIIILDQTIFYPQGGGQPYDQGIIENKNAKFNVQEVRFVEGLVKHFGTFEYGMFAVGDKVTCLVNSERRKLNSRLHSAGHVVDMAIDALKLNWIPAKGFHFPDGPYVEYVGKLENIDKEKIKQDIENLCNSFINEARETKILFIEKDKMKELCRHVPQNLPEGKPTRVVLYGDFGVPCGGTHVSNLQDIQSMTIRKIKQEGPHIRVGYDVSK